MRNDPSQLGSGAVALVDHLARHRVSVVEAMRRAPRLRSLGDPRLDRLLRDAERAGLVASAPLFRGLRCWRLADDGRHAAGLPPRERLALSDRAKLRAYALLRYCFAEEPNRLLLTSSEVAHSLPALAQRGGPSGYCYDAAGRLTLARVDLTASGRWDRPLAALVATTRWCLTVGELRTLAAEGRFEVALITPNRAKALRLADALASNAATRALPARVVADPALAPLAGPRLLSPHPKEAPRRARR